jgi:hypothetical protein
MCRLSQPERIPKIPSRMFVWNIQCIEIVPRIFYLWSISNREPKSHENLFCLTSHEREGMERPTPQWSNGNRHIETFMPERMPLFFFLQASKARTCRFFKTRDGCVDRFSYACTLRRRKVPNFPKALTENASLPCVLAIHRFCGFRIRCITKRSKRTRKENIERFHRSTTESS